MTRFKGAKVTINEFGMRAIHNWKDENNKYKILFYGDSVTFGGSYIDNEDLFSEKLCKLIKNSLCGNFGVNGYQLHNLNLRIQETLKKINLNHLIIVVSDTFLSGKSNFNDFPFYEKFDYNLFRSSSEILNHILFKYDLKNNYHNDQTNNISIKLTDLNDLINTLSSTKINIDVFILPSIENLNQNYNKKHFLEKTHFKNLKVHNMYADIKKISYNDYYFDNSHLNKKGHDYFSEMIYDKIK